MRSTRSIFGASLLALWLAMAGCRSSTENAVDKLSQAPILEDEAMQNRPWDQGTSMYANGYSIAYPTLYPYGVALDQPAYAQGLIAPALFYGQALLIPVTAVVTPPWKEVAYRGVIMPRTYTGVPAPIDDGRYFR